MQWEEKKIDKDNFVICINWDLLCIEVKMGHTCSMSLPWWWPWERERGREVDSDYSDQRLKVSREEHVGVSWIANSTAQKLPKAPKQFMRQALLTCHMASLSPR